MAKKKKEIDNSPEAQAKSWRFKMQLIASCIAVSAILFLPTTILIVIGMLPTLVAYFLDRSSKKSQAVTVGALNLAGCTPVLLQLWTGDYSIASSLDIAFDLKSMVLMYSMAAVGYMMDWALTGMIASLLYQKGKERHAAIERRQIELIEKWGQEVTGSIPLDERGFPITDPLEAPPPPEG